MTCIQKEGETRIIIDQHPPPIIRIPDRLWAEFKKILPKEKPLKTAARPVVTYRKVLDGILYVLRTKGCQWKMLPSEYSSGSTCHSWFQEWNNLDLFKKIWVRSLKIYDKEMACINWT